MLWRLGLFSGPSFHLLLLLQLSQNLSDVLVDLEKQHGGNTVMVKPQPRCVTASLQLWAGVGGGSRRAPGLADACRAGQGWPLCSRGLPAFRGAGEAAHSSGVSHQGRAVLGGLQITRAGPGLPSVAGGRNDSRAARGSCLGSELSS